MCHHDALPGFRIDFLGGKDALAFGFGVFEMAEQDLRVGHVKVPARVFLFRLLEDVAVFQRDRRVGRVEGHVHDVVDAKDVHRQTFEAVGQLSRDGLAVVPANLLEVGELADFHAIAPDFPAQPPSAQCRAFPVIFDKANVVEIHVDPNRFQAAKIEILKIGRRRFDQNLKLVVMLQPVRVFAIAAIGRATGGLNISRGPRLFAQSTQCRCRVERPCADFHVIGLQNRAPCPGPVGLEPEQDFLKTLRLCDGLGHGVSLEKSRSP